MGDKPWEQIPLTIWHFFTRGKRRFISIPLFCLFSFLVALPDTTTKLKKTYDLAKNQLYPTTFLSRQEYNICNEWIIVVWSYENEKKAESEYNLFKKAYTNSGLEAWNKNVMLVRSPSRKYTWQIIVDPDPGPSSHDNIRNRLTNLQSFGNESDKRRNSFGHWLDAAVVTFYDMEQFEYTHGAIKNMPQGCPK